ncbi:hypothetical protein DL240_09750 [Lujinxingia litoralis]|uniref:Outer membrane protein beta-barrel domain-containing protein n=1 Tax=Lujinxingia litoralis TaxID=2211119 RepID=A0A328C4E2_9DELT|nr:hypothetical protein [Lujinxingia litoralis]RAL22129.1 hypothetical protein DL240_09750 [Lujinxingia litoralis]
MVYPAFTARLGAFLTCGLLATATVGAISLSAAAPAHAQDAADSQVSALLDQAMEDYDMLMIEEAEQALEEAVVVAARNNLRTPAVARAYVMLGIVRFAATRDEAMTEEAFVAALETDPNSVLFPVYETPELGQIFERARRRAKPPEPAPTQHDQNAQPDADQPMEHRPIARANAGQAVLFEAFVDETLPVFRVFVHHRRFGEDDFTRSEMTPSSNTRFAFSLDASHVRTSQIEYYIEAVDRTGDVVASSGRTTNPHRISVMGSGTEAPAPSPAPVAQVTPADEEPLELSDDENALGSGFYATLLGGTDVGFLTSGTTPTAQIDREVTPGFVAAFAHAKLDLGWRLTERNSVGAYWRWQFSPAQDFSTLVEGSIDTDAPFWEHEEECFGLGLPGDCLLGIKYQRDISLGAPRFYSSVGLGIGRVRNWLRLKHNAMRSDGVCDNRDIFQDESTGVPFCYIRDTVRTGWAHFGFGGGFYVPLSGHLDFVTDTYVMVLFPDTSINVDVNLGLRLRI